MSNYDKHVKRVLLLDEVNFKQPELEKAFSNSELYQITIIYDAIMSTKTMKQVVKEAIAEIKNVNNIPVIVVLTVVANGNTSNKASYTTALYRFIIESNFGKCYLLSSDVIENKLRLHKNNVYGGFFGLTIYNDGYNINSIELPDMLTIAHNSIAEKLI